MFFQRVHFEVPDRDPSELALRFAPLAARFSMQFRFRAVWRRARIAILVSKQGHCLTDLLTRTGSGELAADVVAVISNHPDHAALARFHQVPYHHLPVTGSDGGHAGEAQQDAVAQVLASCRAETVVLARYMQIIGVPLLERYPEQIINIHHGFLPAFVGAKPYHQAHARGVKLVGATAHYATSQLDQGPIITQDVTAVTHRDTPADLVRKGRDLETVVLADAVRAHIEHRTLVFGNKTVVFG